jgi:hypothetical protein
VEAILLELLSCCGASSAFAIISSCEEAWAATSSTAHAQAQRNMWNPLKEAFMQARGILLWRDHLWRIGCCLEIAI